jgi:hypothetical protein
MFNADLNAAHFDPGAKALFSVCVTGVILILILYGFTIDEVARYSDKADSESCPHIYAASCGFACCFPCTSLLWAAVLFTTLCVSFLPSKKEEQNHYNAGIGIGYICANILCMYLILLGIFYVPTTVCFFFDDICSSMRTSMSNGWEGWEAIPLEEPLTNVHEHALRELTLRDNGRFYGLAHLAYFTKPHPAPIVAKPLKFLQEFKRWSAGQRGAFRGYKNYPNPFYGCIVAIMVFMIVSSCSSTKAAAAAHQSPNANSMAYFFTAKYHLSLFSLSFTIWFVCFPPKAKCVTTPAHGKQSAKYISGENMRLIQAHIERLLSRDTDVSGMLIKGDGILIYELLLRLEISTLSYFKRAILSTVLSSICMLAQTWFNVSRLDS